VSKLHGFDFRVEFKPGALNIIADALSHRGAEEDATAMALSAPSFALFADIQRELDADQDLRALKTEVMEGKRGEEW
jgi:hypothetical protein